MIHIRFYAALVLLDLLQETPVSSVARTFALPCGQVQTLQHTSMVTAMMLSKFCQQLRWHDIASLASSIAPKLRDGVDEELLPLMELSRNLMTGACARAAQRGHHHCYARGQRLGFKT